MKRIAIIGLGGIGNRHALSMEKVEAAELVAGVDCDETKREAFASRYHVPVYDTAGEMFASVRPDGVILATPPSQREALIEEALEAGVSILSEKPLAHDLESAQRIREQVLSRPGAGFYLGFCHRFLGAASHAKEMIGQGELGRVVWMQVIFASNSPGMKQHWMTDRSFSGGGAAMDNAGHALDLFRYLLGGDIKVSGYLRNEWKERGDDSFVLSVQGEEGILGSILGSYVASTPRLYWEICGTDATLRFDYAQGGCRLEKISGNGTLETIEVAPAGERFAGQINAWVAAMEGEAASLASIEDGYRIAEIIDLLESSKEPVPCE